MNVLATGVDPGRVAIYIRWSTDEQSEGTTLQVQRESCEHYILAQGWTVREELIFVDDGYSGGSLERPALTALRQAVRAGQISCVVVFKLDRLSRSVVDTVNLALQEWDGRCFIKSTREPVDTTTSAGKMFFYMLASYAEWERSVIRERTMSGKIKRAQQGKNPGFTAPYGYARGERPGEWVVDGPEADVVRRVFDEYVAGRGIHTIAAGLNRGGIRPRRARSWNATTIAQMLTNPAYTGVLEYGRTTVTPPNLRETVGAARISFDQPRYARVEGALPAVISPERFEQARRVRESKGGVTGRRALGPGFLLSGICRCGACGGPLRGDARAGRDRQHRYYRCGNSAGSKAEPCRAGLIPAAEVEEAVVGAVREAFAPANRERFLSDWRMEAEATAGRWEAEAARIREVLAGMGRRRSRLDADYDAGDLPARLYAARVERLDEEEAQLQALLREAEQGVAQARQASFDAGEFDELAGRIDGWAELTPEERKQVLRHALASCTAFRAQSAGRPGERSPLEVSVTIWRPK